MKCIKCKIGNYLSVDDNKCVACPNECVECTSANNCTKCKSFYGLNQGKCESCSKNPSNYSCLTCNFTYKSYNEKISNCLSCSDGYDEGLNCNPNYPCPKNCWKCKLGKCY